MSITGAIILFAVIWFLVLFILLPFRARSQAEDGTIEPGTHAGAPADFRPGKTAKQVTIIAVVLWAVLAGIINYGGISVRDLDWFQRMGPPSMRDDTNG